MFSNKQELDCKIQNTPIEVTLTSFEQKLLDSNDQASKSFQRLLQIKPIHRDDPEINLGYDNNRKSNINDPNFIASLAKQFRETLEKISLSEGGAFEEDRVHRFLDLGYFPGGFSAFLLDNNRNSRGVGIDKRQDETLSYQTLTDNDHRYKILSCDIIALVLQAVDNGTDPIIPLDAKDGDTMSIPNQYDLVIGGAFPVKESKIPWWIRPQLVLSQLLFILTYTAEGGSAILHVNTKPFCWMAEVIAVLWECFGAVKAADRTTHKTSSSCYIVCRDFKGSDMQVKGYKERTKGMMGCLSVRSQVEGPQDERDPELTMPTMSGRRLDEVFMEEHHKIKELFKECWDRQYEEMYKNLTKKISGRMGSFMPVREEGKGADRDNWRKRE